MAPPEALGGTLLTDLLSTQDPEGRPADGEPGSRVCVKALHGRCLRAPPPLSPAQVGCSLLGNVVLAAAVVGLVVGLAATQRGSRVAEVRTLYASCPTHWIGFGSQCFYFSDDVRNWTSSQAFCESLDANLARFDSMEELNFLQRHKNSYDHWLGLRRQSEQHSWKWADNTEYSNLVKVQGVGQCAYLNAVGIGSGRVYLERRWICSKLSSYAQCGAPASSALWGPS